MKNTEIIKILQECYADDFYYIPQHTGIYIIQGYIKELKGIEVEINPPDNLISLQFYNSMLNTVFNYYMTDEIR